MRLIRCLSDFKGTPNGVAIAIGNFDGFHKGHQAVIECMKEKAERMNLVPAVMIFEPQPLEYFSKDKSPARISSLRDKLLALKSAGVQLVFCMKFNADFAAMSAHDYVIELLGKKLGVKSVTVGTLFNFGQGGKSTIDDLKKIGASIGMEASAIDGVDLNGERISSTKIREYLFKGQLDQAKEALGRYYSMSGIVVHGNRIGRNLGFPTANMNVNRRISPLKGVYAVKVSTRFGLKDGMANVGVRPTVMPNQTKAILEVNIFDFDKDLYGQSIRVFFIKKIRDEMKFDDIELLKEQLKKDKTFAQEFLLNHNVNEF
ncbi:bifunctional riboflavin kinase/FAD synthetase [Succinivibrio dextrinosolvens]|uniref:bifunctional riboflavin kinase/FAD synthetase n=1 Tax=Succinivibrio dextrinosolvens TaxID=83771 RepID=UPI00241F87DE|nr:bifunctional riboflavin kinase/FAD synthetase [Succinivibrio dextrinosolvens]MBE6422104.1 bifunctional riboflavin kinase/FAD synthetase [Succinivibrio dextrinosolvens]